MEPYDALPEAVVVLDEDRTVTACNDRAGRLLGVDERSLGIHLGDAVTLLDSGGAVCRDPVPERGVADRLAERVLVARLADGRTRPVAMAGRWLPDGGVVLTFRSAARHTALEARRADLVATVSHEIRSPLTSVKGFTRTLLARWDRFSDEQKRSMLATMAEDADRVTRLLTELLDVARIDAHRVQLHVSGIDVAHVARAVAAKARQRPDGDGRDLVVTVADDVADVLFADADKVEQVLTNLVDNALRHAPGSPVVITVAGRADGGVRVDVSDEGPGIAQDQQRLVFEKFGQGGGRRRAGTGLGLYISRGLARAHGGDLAVTSEPGQGATFTLTLPPGTPPG